MASDLMSNQRQTRNNPMNSFTDFLRYTMHLKNTFATDELVKDSVSSKMELTAQDRIFESDFDKLVALQNKDQKNE